MATIVTGSAGEKELTLDLGTSDDGSVFESVSVSVELNIYETTKTSPVLGIYSELEQTGWLWDKALLVTDQFPNTKYDTYTGGNQFKLREGTIRSDWVSGALEGVENYALTDIYEPLIFTGTYTISSSVRNLYSDFSYTSYIDPNYEPESGLTGHALPDDYQLGSIRVYGFKRGPSLINEIIFEYDIVDEFTDTYYKQYRVTDDKVVLNESPVMKHGIDPSLATWDLIRTHGVSLGSGTGDPKDYYLDFFPVLEDTLKAFILYSDGTIERWDLVDSFDFSESNDTHLVLNPDLGVLSSGGQEFDSLVTSEAITASDIEIPFYTTKDTASYPKRGIVHLGDETVSYTDRTQNKLLNCTRGYLGTTAVEHGIGTVVEFERRGYPITEDAELFVYYESTARIDCEITDSSQRTGEPDCRPSKNPTASQIVQISAKLRDLDRLVLESDKPSLGANTYGPVFFGNDTSKLTVTAYDSEDNPVDNLQITLEILDPVIGLLDGESTSVVKISNSEGKIFAYYNSPIDINDYATKFDSVTYSSGKTLFTIDDIDDFAELKDIYIFQLLKHDPSFGMSGEKWAVKAYSSTTTRPNAEAVVTVDGTVGQQYEGGIAYCLSTAGVLYTREIVQVDGDDIYLAETIPSVTLETIYLVGANDIEWDSSLLNGVPVIVYKFDNEAEHPITGKAGAYMPIKPESITNDVVAYNMILPTPYPDDRDNNLGGYMIIAPTNVSLRAKATDPYSGQLIYSNTIVLSVRLPNYLVGVDRSGALPVPKGFNLIVSEENVGNGLEGANFFTINKTGGLYGLQIRFTKS